MLDCRRQVVILPVREREIVVRGSVRRLERDSFAVLCNGFRPLLVTRQVERSLETMELLRDPIRLAFAFFGPLILMVAFGYGISFDVEHLRFAALDQDRTPESRSLIEAFTSSPRYFNERPPIGTSDELDRRLRSGDIQIAIEIPPGFGRDLQVGDEGKDGAVEIREVGREPGALLGGEFVGHAERW